MKRTPSIVVRCVAPNPELATAAVEEVHAHGRRMCCRVGPDNLAQWISPGQYWFSGASTTRSSTSDRVAARTLAALHDVDAARTAGVQAIGVASGGGSTHQLRYMGATASWYDLTDTEAIVAFLVPRRPGSTPLVLPQLTPRARTPHRQPS